MRGEISPSFHELKGKCEKRRESIDICCMFMAFRISQRRYKRINVRGVASVLFSFHFKFHVLEYPTNLTVLPSLPMYPSRHHWFAIWQIDNRARWSVSDRTRRTWLLWSIRETQTSRFSHLQHEFRIIRGRRDFQTRVNAEWNLLALLRYIFRTNIFRNHFFAFPYYERGLLIVSILSECESETSFKYSLCQKLQIPKRTFINRTSSYILFFHSQRDFFTSVQKIIFFHCINKSVTFVFTSLLIFFVHHNSQSLCFSIRQLNIL